MGLRLAFLVLFAAIGGAAITVQAGLNGQVARALGHPLWATLLSLAVSVLTILPMLVLFRVGVPNLSQISGTPWWIWIGGALGAFFITAALIAAPQLGAVTFVAAVVMGQLLVSLILDQFAIAGFPERPISLFRVIGVCLVIAGVVMTAIEASAKSASS